MTDFNTLTKFVTQISVANFQKIKLHVQKSLEICDRKIGHKFSKVYLTLRKVLKFATDFLVTNFQNFKIIGRKFKIFNIKKLQNPSSPILCRTFTFLFSVKHHPSPTPSPRRRHQTTPLAYAGGDVAAVPPSPPC